MTTLGNALRLGPTLLLAGALLGACRDEPAAPSAPQPIPAAPGAPSAPEPASTSAPTPDAEARALIAEWLAAQNGGDFTRYAALYAGRFTGVRRTGSKTRAFDRAGWLADRKRMFARPMQVKAGEPRVTRMGPTTVVRFDQEWSTATYRDLGPKQMVLVREAGALRIAREELLHSSGLPASGSSARFVIRVGARSYVLLESAGDTPPGTALAVAALVGPPSAAVFDRGSAPSPASMEAWRGGPLRLIGPHGTCESQPGAARTVAVGYPHFGVVQSWQDEAGTTVAPLAQIAGELAAMYPAWVALEIEQPCAQDAVLALPPGAPPAAAFAQVDADPALRARAQQAFAALPELRALAPADRDDLLGDLSINVFGRSRPEWIAVAASTGCAKGLEQLALFQIDGDSLSPRLTSRKTELLFVWALVDLDGDELPEVAGSPWTPAQWLLIESRSARVLQRSQIPYNDCPC